MKILIFFFIIVLMEEKVKGAGEKLLSKQNVVSLR